MGRHLGIDFRRIVVDFWKQVGRENGAKIDTKRHRKNDGKKKGSKIAKNAQKVRATRCGTTGPRPRGGPPLSRRGNPQSHDRAIVGSPPRPKDVSKDPSGIYSL